MAITHNELFGTNVSENVFAMHCVKKLNLRRAFSGEQEEWLKINYPILGTTKATEEFNRTFHQNRTWDTIRTHCIKHGIKCNSDVLSKRGRNNARMYVPVGTITEDSQGYLHIKTSDKHRRKADNWELYHRWLWEKKNGKVPDDCYLIFLDNDRKNCDLSNLALIPKAYIAIMMKYQLKSESRQITETSIKWCDLFTTAKKNGVINETFFRED